MATTTKNYNLVKPSPTDLYDIAVQNGNMDKIDTALKALEIYIGTNPITTPDNDTYANWKALGTGYCFYSAVGQLNGQPTQYGHLINIASSGSVSQIWMTLPKGTLYYRGGNSNGMAASWTNVLNNEDISTTFQTLVRRDTIGSNKLVDADTLTTPGVHQVYFEDSTYDPADYNLPHQYGVLCVDSTVSYVGQTFYAVATNKLWYRTRATSSSNWGDWHQVYDTSNKPSLADLGIIYSETEPTVVEGAIWLQPVG